MSDVKILLRKTSTRVTMSVRTIQKSPMIEDDDL